MLMPVYIQCLLKFFDIIFIIENNVPDNRLSIATRNNLFHVALALIIQSLLS